MPLYGSCFQDKIQIPCHDIQSSLRSCLSLFLKAHLSHQSHPCQKCHILSRVNTFTKLCLLPRIPMYPFSQSHYHFLSHYGFYSSKTQLRKSLPCYTIPPIWGSKYSLCALDSLVIFFLLIILQTYFILLEVFIREISL